MYGKGCKTAGMPKGGDMAARKSGPKMPTPKPAGGTKVMTTKRKRKS